MTNFLKRAVLTARDEKIKFLSWVVLIVSLSVVIFQANSPKWRDHLKNDAPTFHARGSHFIEKGSWSGMDYNEYQPGALWFFVAINGAVGNTKNFDSFLSAVVIVNIILIIGHFIFLSRASGGKYASLLFAVLVLAAGPILLYRFELLVSLIILFSWSFFKNKKKGLSAFALGLGSSIKLYPAVLVPLLAMDSIVKKRWRELASIILFFTFGFGLPILFFIFWGGEFEGFLTSIKVHGLKPIGLESLWGNLIAFLNLFFGLSFDFRPAYGISGVVANSKFLSSNTLNNLPILITIISLLAIGLVYKKRGYERAELAFFVLFVFTFFAKVLNPQYLWWFLIFLPYVSEKLFKKKEWIIIYTSAILSLALTQIVFPLNYSSFLDWFRPPIRLSWLLFFLSLRNGTLVFLLIIVGRKIFSRSYFEDNDAPLR